MKMDTKFFILLLILLVLWTLPVQAQNSSKVIITHGPVLGRLSHEGIGIWVRTSTPSEFRVRLWTDDGIRVKAFNGNTALQHDNTGWVHITGLQYNTTYRYEVDIPSSGFSTEGGTFTTLPHADQFRNADHNPKGLFNFSFEFACGNKQEPGILELDMPVFETMMNQLHGKIHFQIMNGDFIYEDGRELALTEWQSRNRVSDANVPRLLSIAPTLVGVWENYKLYYDRSPNLRRFHRNIPAFFMFDDHEILNDVYGTGSPGIRLRRAVFRDIGVQGWRDYVGWSNPLPQNHQGIHFGRANIHAGSNILEDPDADFTKLDLEQAGTLHVHWDEPTAGSPNVKLDGVGGHPAAGVYAVESILGPHRLQISPLPVADGNRVSYSIGMLNNYRYRIANCDFFVLDTKSHREMHDTNDPWKEGLSMLGVLQKRWLKEGMRNSDADFFFVVSSVNLMVPHVGSGGGTIQNKDDAWTVFMQERDELIQFWDGLGKPVFVLTGDIHNSFVIQITDRVWEFASGPHNSQNHVYTDEGGRPANGPFEYNDRTCDIRWSTYLLDDIPRKMRRIPIYCVVQVNNVFNNPKKPGEDRWIAYPYPQVVFHYHDGVTGDMLYAESIRATIK